MSDTELKSPRVTSRQRNRANVPAGSPEQYYKTTVFIPFLDHVTTDLRERFSEHNRAIFCLSCLIPQSIDKYKFADLLPAVDVYGTFLDMNKTRLRSDFELWQQRWGNVPVADRPKTAIDSFAACNAQTYPNVAVLLQILTTLPVTTATAERTFYTLKRLKTYLRSTMSDDRLTSLALVNIHAETIAVDVNEVIDKFALSGPHKLNFLK
jgi:hypothetical protein